MQLQTLDVRHTSILTVPKSMTELEKLQYVRAGIGPLHSNSTVAPDDEDSSEMMMRRRSMPPALLAACLPSKYSRRRPDPAMVGVEMPSGMGKLTSLHTLGVVNISWTKAILEELQNLTQLHKLGVSGVNRDNYRKFFSAISGHVHLESLSVQLDKDMNQSGHSWSLDNIPHSQYISNLSPVSILLPFALQR
ncbi:hypothetical protein BAE44_0006974 [Dichanthelium oligosanthes]|uniref:Uncharacterized protein n=1 Tax=Dichanthelium oligosanthes TaxID=888268 RepID=A0A1E5W400_9POAL|nr:hypothetical protein BAE44_0006974 [Dichanthelium oligosanthes]